jgi:hypothetical protein
MDRFIFMSSSQISQSVNIQKPLNIYYKVESVMVFTEIDLIFIFEE